MINVNIVEFSGMDTMVQFLHSALESSMPIDSDFTNYKLGKNDAWFVTQNINKGGDCLKHCKVTCNIYASLYWCNYVLSLQICDAIRLVPLSMRELSLADFSVERMNKDERKTIYDAIFRLNSTYDRWMIHSCQESLTAWHGLLPQCFMRKGTVTFNLNSLKRAFDERVSEIFTEWEELFDALDENGVPLMEYVTGWK